VAQAGKTTAVHVLVVGTSWPTQNALLLAVAWPALIVAVILQLAGRRCHSAAR
jgi:pimeloyl-ACP methyl ester carboxylesterase